jgi:ribosomal protein S25
MDPNDGDSSVSVVTAHKLGDRSVISKSVAGEVRNRLLSAVDMFWSHPSAC